MKTRQLLMALALGLGLALVLAMACSAGKESNAATAVPGDPAELSAEAWDRIVGQVQNDHSAFIRQTAKITASDGAANAYFADKVAIDGDIAVVGAYGDSANTGAVYVFERNLGGADNWGQRAKLTTTLGTSGDYFGAAVDIDGDTIVVGALGVDSYTGAAYVFGKNAGGADNWGQTAKITVATGTSNDRFGSAVAIDGDAVIIGAPGAYSSAGVAYIFERNEGGADNWGLLTTITATDGLPPNYFGCAAAMSGDTIVIGAYSGNGAASDTGAAYVFEQNEGGADNWGQTAKLTATGGIADDRFGYSVAVDGSIIVVGAPRQDDNGSDAGSVYIFARNAGGADNWGQVAQLTASDGGDEDWFGESVAASGDMVLVGAPYDDDAGSASGSAYVFGQNAGGADNWGQTAKLAAAGGTEGDNFGYAVALDRHTLLVGAYGDSDSGTSSGSAYVFTRRGVTFKEESRPTSPDVAAGDYFGYDVAVDRDIAVVGVPYDDDNGANAGAVYVFARNAGGANRWGQVAKITASDGAAQDTFGRAVAIDGNIIVVGADGESSLSSTPGAAYVFARNAGGADNWGQAAKLTITGGAADDGFGHGVAVAGNIIVVGAPYNDDNGDRSGAAYVFSRNAGGADNWGLLTTLSATGVISDDRFGYAVAISGDVIAISAEGDDDNGVNSGSVYLFSRNVGSADNWGQTAHISPTDIAAVDFFGKDVAIDGDTLVVGSYDDDDACPWSTNCNSGSAYVFRRNEGGADHWGQAAKITATDSITYDQFGISVAIDGDVIAVGAAYHDPSPVLTNTGAVYVFARNEGGMDNWGQMVKLTARGGRPGDQFGYTVAVDRDIVFVGAWYFDDAGGNSGLSFIYRERLLDAYLPVATRNHP
jgi:hypothetical protein